MKLIGSFLAVLLLFLVVADIVLRLLGEGMGTWTADERLDDLVRRSVLGSEQSEQEDNDEDQKKDKEKPRQGTD